MDILTNYLLESSICLAVFYTFYFLVLKSLTSFQWNRFYLILSLLLSCSIPLMSFNIFPIYYNSTPLDTLSTLSNQVVADTPDNNPINLATILMGLYAIIAFLFIVRLVYNSTTILKKIKQSEKLNKGDYTFVLNNDETKVYSFFNFLIAPSDQQIDDFVLKHELTHIKQKHSLDIVVSEIIKAILWFNPFIYLIQKAIKLNHEFICDYHASKIKDNYHYAKYLALVNQTEYKLTLVNNFAYKLKNRIIMLQKLDYSKNQKWRYFLILPLICGALSLFSFDEYYVPIENNTTSLLGDTLPTKMITVIDTITTFDYDTYEETLEIVKSQQEVIEVIDTTTVFNYDTYEETLEIVKTQIPVKEYIENLKNQKKVNSKDTLTVFDPKSKTEKVEITEKHESTSGYDTITVFDYDTYTETVTLVKREMGEQTQIEEEEEEEEEEAKPAVARKLIHQNLPAIINEVPREEYGKSIVAKVCINQKGLVVYAELLNSETTMRVPAGKQKAILRAIYGYKYEPLPGGPSEQCQKLRITLSKNSNGTANQMAQVKAPRKVIYRNTQDVLTQLSTKKAGELLVAKVCINKKGKVVKVEIDSDNMSMTLNKREKKSIIKAIKKYKYEANPNAPDEEWGTLRIRLEE